tara:strand:+ start:793 stop:1548 length:756 start_codon:yes stop_codon:yes gene_type:complete
MEDFVGKTTLVTGASRGIGKAIALEFARRGSNIAFNYLRNHKAAADSKKEIEALGVKCVAVRAHLGDTDKIDEMFKNISNEFKTLNILINNAASGVQKRANELQPKHWDWAMNINARAPWICSIKASELMHEGGNIINITSEGSRTVLPYYLSVGTSKAALESLTKYLAVELAEKNINVNAISGGYIETGAFDSFPNKESMSEATAKTLSGRKMTAQDIANVAVFLCTNKADMIRGQILVVDGGVTLSANL